jgi:hypothetical protein
VRRILALAALVLAAATSAIHAYADTPQRAALAVVVGPHAPHPRVVRTNVAGRFATVLTSGGEIEGQPVREALLVEHFAFGWQPVGILNDGCALATPTMTAADRRALLAGMPRSAAHGACEYPGTPGDIGPAAAVTAVRKQMMGAIVGRVVVSRDYALGTWCCPGGGVELFRRHGADWMKVTGGGGVLDASGLRSYGVPAADAANLVRGYH